MFIIKRLQHRYFPLNIAKIFQNTYFEEHLRPAASDLLMDNFLRDLNISLRNLKDQEKI